MYYGLIILSVCMFGGCFALNDVYRRMRGSSLKISMQFSLTSSVAGLLVLLMINGFQPEFTPFTLVMAIWSALNGLCFTLCSFRSLGIINLSVYSLFSMLGGMVLPFLQGILFYDEDMTLAKGVCFLLICAALLLTVEKGGKKGGTIYYMGIFVLNGMSGVISKIFTSAPYEKTGAAGYSVLCAFATIVISGVALLWMRKEETPKATAVSIGTCAVSGITNRLANYFLVLALAHVHASVQYPMVTGGVIIVSTLICFLGENKPSKREILSVALAFIGVLALVLIPA